MAAKIIRLNFGNSGNTAPVLPEEVAYADSDILDVEASALDEFPNEENEDEYLVPRFEGQPFNITLSMPRPELFCLARLLDELEEKYSTEYDELCEHFPECENDYDRTIDLYYDSIGQETCRDVLRAAAIAIRKQLKAGEPKFPPVTTVYTQFRELKSSRTAAKKG